MGEIGLGKDWVQFEIQLLGRCHTGSWICRSGAQEWGMGHKKIWNDWWKGENSTYGGGFTLKNPNIYVGQARRKKASKETLPTWPCSPVNGPSETSSPLPKQKHLSILAIKPYPASVKPSLCTRKLQPELPLLDSSHLTNGQRLSRFFARTLKIASICALSP